MKRLLYAFMNRGATLEGYMTTEKAAQKWTFLKNKYKFIVRRNGFLVFLWTGLIFDLEQYYTTRIWLLLCSGGTIGEG